MNSSKLLPAQFLYREVFWYLGVHRYFHSTVHVSTALCTCWGTCWALDPDSCCTCPPFWAEPVAWTSTLCLDTRHGFITLGAHARVRARTVFDVWQAGRTHRRGVGLSSDTGWRMAAVYRSLAAMTQSRQLELTVGGERWVFRINSGFIQVDDSFDWVIEAWPQAG